MWSLKASISIVQINEAPYELSRITSFGPNANRWAPPELHIMLGGQANDPGVARMLARLRDLAC